MGGTPTVVCNHWFGALTRSTEQTIVKAACRQCCASPYLELHRTCTMLLTVKRYCAVQ